MPRRRPLSPAILQASSREWTRRRSGTSGSIRTIEQPASARSTSPSAEEEASKFIREAVRTYPELYFARFVVLGEGASEEVVLPRLAEAMGLDIDRSFVAVVPWAAGM